MKMEMTARDKKLLVFLALFVIIVGIGYWGIYPMIRDIGKFSDEIKEQEALKEQNDYMISELPFEEEDNEMLEKKIVEARKDFYPMMSSDEIDKMFTGMILEYNLEAYKLDIQFDTEEAYLAPYDYSQKKIEADALYAEQVANGEYEYEEELPQTGIYTVHVSLKLGAEDESMIQEFVDALYLSDKEHLVKNYGWEDNSKNVIFINQYGQYDVRVEYEKVLNLTVDMYMCQE